MLTVNTQRPATDIHINVNVPLPAFVNMDMCGIEFNVNAFNVYDAPAHQDITLIMAFVDV